MCQAFTHSHGQSPHGQQHSKQHTGGLFMDFFDELDDVLEDLYFLSEHEAPAESYVWDQDGEFTVETLLEVEGFEPETAVEVGELSDLIDGQVEAHADDDDEASRFEDLRVFLEDNLEDIEVYYVGDEEITVYVLGKLPDGTLAGLVTELVE
jgi:hypothetical protein